MKSYILASLFTIVTISEPPRLIRHLLSNVYDECTDLEGDIHCNADTNSGVLKCDTGYHSYCDFPLEENCLYNCVFTQAEIFDPDECTDLEGDIHCIKDLNGVLRCDIGYHSYCGYPIEEDCLYDCVKFDECIGTDTNCHTKNGVLTCDAGFMSLCGNEFNAHCDANCRQYNECMEGSTGCVYDGNYHHQCESGLFSACGNFPLTEDCAMACVAPMSMKTRGAVISKFVETFDECTDLEGDSHCNNDINGVLKCDAGYHSYCGFSLEENCLYDCVKDFNQCIGTDTNCRSINGVFTCDAGFMSLCGNSLTYDCGYDCRQYNECMEGGIGCVYDGYYQCESGFVSACGDFPLVKDCVVDCLKKKYDQCPGSDINCRTRFAMYYPYGVLTCDIDANFVSACGNSLTENCNENCEPSEFERVSR